MFCKRLNVLCFYDCSCYLHNNSYNMWILVFCLSECVALYCSILRSVFFFILLLFVFVSYLFLFSVSLLIVSALVVCYCFFICLFSFLLLIFFIYFFVFCLDAFQMSCVVTLSVNNTTKKTKNARPNLALHNCCSCVHKK